MTPQESPTWNCLHNYLTTDELQDSVFIHDNTEQNIWLAKAYNLGVAEARKRGKQWCVLLDQDTELTSEYLNAIAEITCTSTTTPKVYIPTLLTNGKCVSPVYYSVIGGPGLSGYVYTQSFSIKRFFPGKCLCGFNSATLFNMAVISLLGGFNTDFPFYELDFWFFCECHKKHISVELLPYTLNHSVCDGEGCTNTSVYVREHIKSDIMPPTYYHAEKRLAQHLGFVAVVLWHIRMVIRKVGAI